MEQRELSLFKNIKIRTSKKLNTAFVGEYHSAFKGHGISFDNVREYQYGDDIKSIDWNVSARMNHLYIKEYIEERDLSVVLLLDVSSSTEFGTSRTKRDLILEVATIFLYLAQMNNDSISVILFSDKIEKFIKPQKGRKFILKVLDEILKCKPDSKATNITDALNFSQKVLKKRSIIFLISDFLDKSEYLLKLKHISRKHDVIPIQIIDSLENKIPFFGLTEFLDLETQELFLSDAIPEQGNVPILSGFDFIKLRTDEPVEKPILKFFEKRNRSHYMR